MSFCHDHLTLQPVGSLGGSKSVDSRLFENAARHGIASRSWVWRKCASFERFCFWRGYSDFLFGAVYRNHDCGLPGRLQPRLFAVYPVDRSTRRSTVYRGLPRSTAVYRVDSRLFRPQDSSSLLFQTQRHRNDKGQRTKDKPQAKQSLLRPSRPLESLVTHPPVP